jgi:hypothetical protein
MAGAILTLPFESYCEGETGMAREPVISIYKKLPVQLVCDPPQPLQENVVRRAIPNWDCNEPMPRPRFDEVNESFLVRSI